MRMIRMKKEEIMEVIPHREPMLLLDAVTAMIDEVSIEAELYLNPTFDFFRGHFPSMPVMPGVLAVEAMAQAADVLLLSTERYKGTIPYFIGIDSVAFKKKIEPGDTIRIEAKIVKENKEKAIATCEANVYNGEDLSTTGIVTLAMR